MAARRRGKGAEGEKKIDRKRGRERSDTKHSRECDGRMILPRWKRTERR